MVFGAVLGVVFGVLDVIVGVSFAFVGVWACVVLGVALFLFCSVSFLGVEVGCVWCETGETSRVLKKETRAS